MLIRLISHKLDLNRMESLVLLLSDLSLVESLSLSKSLMNLQFLFELIEIQRFS